jgi:hypothetical protein
MPTRMLTPTLTRMLTRMRMLMLMPTPTLMRMPTLMHPTRQGSQLKQMVAH